MQGGAQHPVGRGGERHAALARDLVLTVQDLALVVEAVERRREVQNIARDHRRLIIRKRRLDALGEHGDRLGERRLLGGRAPGAPRRCTIVLF